MEYDAIGRMTRRKGFNSNGQLVDQGVWDFDIGTAAKGKLFKVTALDGSYHQYSYDALGRPVTATTKVAGDPMFYPTENTYDANTGQLRNMLYPESSLKGQ